MNKKFTDALASYSAAAMLANGAVKDDEKAVCKDICADLEIDWKKFEPVLNKEILAINQLKDDEFAPYLEKAAKGIAENEKNILFEAAMNLILADKVLSYDECETISAIADILDFPTEMLIARIAFAVQEDSIAVDVEEELSNM